MTPRDGWGWFLLVTGTLSLVNGAWGLFGSQSWYEAIAVDTGPLNVHFVRDIGEIFLTLGGALVWAAYAPRWRAPLTGVVSLFLAFHALGHVYEIAVGELPAHHWLEDLPGVFLPGVLFPWLTWHFLKAPPETAS